MFYSEVIVKSITGPDDVSFGSQRHLMTRRSTTFTSTKTHPIIVRAVTKTLFKRWVEPKWKFKVISQPRVPCKLVNRGTIGYDFGGVYFLAGPVVHEARKEGAHSCPGGVLLYLFIHWGGGGGGTDWYPLWTHTGVRGNSIRWRHLSASSRDNALHGILPSTFCLLFYCRFNNILWWLF